LGDEYFKDRAADILIQNQPVEKDNQDALKQKAYPYEPRYQKGVVGVDFCAGNKRNVKEKNVDQRVKPPDRTDKAVNKKAEQKRKNAAIYDVETKSGIYDQDGGYLDPYSAEGKEIKKGCLEYHCKENKSDQNKKRNH
jgi:hypothetical protein